MQPSFCLGQNSLVSMGLIQCGPFDDFNGEQTFHFVSVDINNNSLLFRQLALYFRLF
jgi:hypothetical protein